LAVIDIYMPDFDGVKLIKAMRQRAPDFPVIAMSGVFLAKSQRMMLDYLPDLPGLATITCLKKPFRPPDLLSAVQIALGDSMRGPTSIVPGSTPCQAS
jgi:CheY-like chemotaxis protein